MIEQHAGIVVGIDGSSTSLEALRVALDAGVQRHADVLVIHCWQPQTLTDLAFGSPHELSRASICMLDNEVTTALAAMPDRPHVIKKSIHGRPATALVDASEAAELLVVGAHGLTAPRDLIFGRVTNSCIKNARCQVVVVEPDGSTTRHGAARAVQSIR